MVRIEEATSEDADDICRICITSWRETYADILPDEYIEANDRVRYEPERIAGQIEESDGTVGWLLALDGEESEEGEPHETNETVLGVIRGERLEPGVGEVFSLYIHPDWQGEGVGSRLLTALTERQRERGVTEQLVYVFAEHDDAIGFYESKGFDREDRSTVSAVDGVDPNSDAIHLSRSI